MLEILFTILKHPIRSIKHPGSIIYPNTWCNDAFVKYLRSKGLKVGKNTRFISPSKCSIDPGRLDYIKIGDNCCLSVVSILAHDYSWYTLLDTKRDLLPDSGGKVTIGNNVFVGYGALILKDTEIGDNVIIGARAVVKGRIPSNTVWAGCPAKQICTIEELYERRVANRVSDAISRRNHIREKYNREVTITDMGLFAYLFLERNEDNYNRYFRDVDINGVKDSPYLRSFFYNSSPSFSSFEEFLKV